MATKHDVDQADLDQIQSILDKHFQPEDHQEAQELILGALQEVQHLLGWVPQDAAKVVADHLGVSINRIYGLLTFYADFRTEPPGNNFMLLCHGSACFIGGSQRLIEELRDRYGITNGGTTADGELTVQVVNGCLGVCDMAPIVQMNHRDYYGNLTVDSFNKVIQEQIAREPADRHHETD
ncbi:MAG: NAD(P)H-dependent oxidoreductase subunit E [Chloroflexota bacterium]